MATDLTLVSTDDLLREIFRRHDAAVVLLQVERIKREDWTWTHVYHGSLNTCLGLATRFTHEALNGFNGGDSVEFTDVSEDDDDPDDTPSTPP